MLTAGSANRSKTTARSPISTTTHAIAAANLVTPGHATAAIHAGMVAVAVRKRRSIARAIAQASLNSRNSRTVFPATIPQVAAWGRMITTGISTSICMIISSSTRGN